ncbi:sorting nexin-24 [Nilaparvata lugens]|uniref:sorting nexin-24 n=1 Tax=Nilaparvata lugens TaxID=108931 RepID=UPI000B990036|nr:sorting nexin-24 [Nilaparvata lugens]
MNEIYIPRYRLIQVPKPYYVYSVEVIIDCLQHKVEKRYSAFHSLHRELRKSFKTPPFPPKRVRCAQPKVLEQRRQSLEKYLQTMFKFAPSRTHILTFLGISKTPPEGPEKNKNLGHHPVFCVDPQTDLKRSSLPDIITDGVLDAIYKY